MPGLGTAVLGASGPIAPLPSPAAGTGPLNAFMQIAQAAASLPQAEQEAKKNKLDLQAKQQQVQQIKMQTAQQKLDLFKQQLKGNPQLAQAPGAVNYLQGLYRDIGVPAPIVEGGSPSSSSAGTAGASGASPGAPAQIGRQPMGQAGPPAPASMQQGYVGPGAPRIDVNALFPHTTLTDVLDKNPEFYKVLQSAKPDQRGPLLEQFGITPGSPGYDNLVNMSVSKSPQERNADLLTFRAMFQDYTKGNASPDAVRAGFAFLAPQLKEDGYDTSALLTPELTARMGQAVQAKIDSIRKTGAFKDAQIKELESREMTDIAKIGQYDAQSNLANVKAQLLPEMQRSLIQSRLAASQHAGKNIQLRLAEFNQRQQGHSVSQFNQARSALASQATNLRGQITGLQGEMKTLFANNPKAIDPATGKTYMEGIADHINVLQPLLDQTTNALQRASIGKEAVMENAVQNALGTTQKVLTQSKAPQGAVYYGHQTQGPRTGESVYKKGNTYVYGDGTPVQ